jgi:hypothetical protein
MTKYTKNGSKLLILKYLKRGKIGNRLALPQSHFTPSGPSIFDNKEKISSVYHDEKIHHNKTKEIGNIFLWSTPMWPGNATTSHFRYFHLTRSTRSSMRRCPLHGKKRRARCSTGLNNVLLPTLFTLVNNMNSIVEPESGVTILFNIVDSYEQCGQQNIVQSCFHQYCINLSVFCRVRH